MPDRSRRVRLALIFVAVAALAVAGFTFAYATVQNHHTEAALAAEIRAHCLADAHVSNRQRTLDLGLIAADRHYLAVLHAEAERPASVHDENLIDAEDAWLTHVLDVRYADLPPYRDPARC